MAAAGGSWEPEYYFDVCGEQWWILRSTAQGWEPLSRKEAESLSLHDAVMQQRCTFVDTSLQEYEEAVSRMSGRAETQDHTSATYSKSPWKSKTERRISVLYDRPTDGDITDTDQFSLASIPYGSQSIGLSQRSSAVSVANSINSNRTDSEVPLQELPRIRASVKPVDKTQAPVRKDIMSLPAPQMPPEKLAQSLDSLKQAATTGHGLGNKISNLIAESTTKKQDSLHQEEKPIEKVDSFVRTAVRQLTQHDKESLADSIKAVAEERERMRKMGTMKLEKDKPRRYERLMERARTMAAVSKTSDFKEKDDGSSKTLSLLSELRKEVSKDAEENENAAAEFDVSSGTSSPVHRKQSTVEELMSQRLSLRRTLTRKHSSNAES